MISGVRDYWRAMSWRQQVFWKLGLIGNVIFVVLVLKGYGIWVCSVNLVPIAWACYGQRADIREAGEK